MRKQPEPRRREIERLLEQLRRQVVQLHRLERESQDEGGLLTSRQAVAELHWRLARLVANNYDDGRPVAA